MNPRTRHEQQLYVDELIGAASKQDGNICYCKESLSFIIHRMKSIQIKEDNAWLYDSTEFYSEQIWCGTCRGFKRQALYTTRKNPWFCVAKRTGPTSKTPMEYFNYSSFLYHTMNFIVLTAVLAMHALRWFCLLKVPNRLIRIVNRSYLTNGLYKLDGSWGCFTTRIMWTVLDIIETWTIRE